MKGKKPRKHVPEDPASRDGTNRFLDLFSDNPPKKLSTVLLIVLSFVAFGNTIRFDYTYLDDQYLILQNLHVLTQIESIPRLFLEDLYLSPSDAYYRPILSLSLMVDAILWKENPLGYHLSNVIYHCIAVVLVHRIFLILLPTKRLSFLLASLFAVHPALNQAISWIPGRDDILLTIATLLSFLPLMRDGKSVSSRSLWWSSLGFVFALFTKETAFFIIPLLVIYLAIFKPKVSMGRLSVGYSLALAVYVLMRSFAFTNPIPLDPRTMIKSVWISSPALLQFLGKTIFPFHLSVLPSIPDTPFIWGWLTLLLLIFIGFKADRKSLFGFGFGWFFILILPSFLRPEIHTVPYFLEHRLYLPILGIFMILGSLSSTFKVKPVHVVLTISVLGLLTVLAIWNGRYYSDRYRYWTRAVETAHHQPIGYKNLGNVFYVDGRFDDAERFYLRALELDPYDSMVHHNLGLILARKADVGEAERKFRKALQLDPDYVDAWYNLGVLYGQTGKEALMIQSWEKALSLDPNHIGTLIQLSRYYIQKNEPDRSEFYLERLESINAPLPSDLVRRP